MSKRLVLYLASLLLVYLVVIFQTARQPLENDFSIMYASARLFLEGESLYAPVEIERFQQWDPDRGPRYPYLLPNLNPPFLTLLILPLAGLPYSAAFWVFSILSLAAGVGSMLLLERETRVGIGNSSRKLLFALLLLVYYPTYMNLSYGQLGLFLFLLVTLAWRRLRHRSDGWGGLWLGLALALKLFAGLFALLLLVRRRIRALLWMGGTFLFCWGIGVLVFGLDSLLEYRSVLALISWSADSWNASFLGFFSRLFGGSESVPIWDAPQLGRALAALCSVASALILVAAARLPANAVSGSIGSHRITFDLSFSLTISLMLLLSPLGWAYYFSILLLPMAIAWKASSGWLIRSCIILGGLLAGAPFPLLDAARIDTHLERFLYSGVYFYGLILLAGTLVYLILRQRRSLLSETSSVIFKAQASKLK